ncbi:GntR family transcriptional regulator / MocR family aminotransferase [Streptomyces sp. SceaMP-e96]|uniref:MocR-like pyridoxine biosynthesis transcription factor PdxR n=1 Tax=Streptomyces TaxID=1883 RepID=UPI0008237B5B|nr:MULTISPECIES: PLP-dependent aminotransferase family protein [unclassified Streptomyces]MYT16166.1 aminotransferase class I/II-fold pyridoxal phosphate-dependent enzyme [Streptomyces sp. SID4951]SCK30797.1 GntR family transcriptional regulator / MocR family aminotransferase [Streptomyces sp. SceaMP-e96]
MSWQASIEISRNSGESLTAQVQRTIKREISDGVLHPGTRLPSSRRLAGDLQVSRSVVVEAYGQLVAEGYLEAVQGSGTRVVRHLSAAPVVPTLLDEGQVPSVRWDLRSGTVSVAHFPYREWLGCNQRVLRTVRQGDLGYPPPSGVPAMREEVARYLGRVRGVCTAPGQVMVVSGFAQGLGLLCAALPGLGIGTLAMEDPGLPRQREFVQEAGMRTVPVPVDEEGVDVQALARSGARAVLVTPFHQFPTGVTLSPERREALVAWARDVDGYVIEDDYDGDFWFDRRARPLALQRQAPERVVYAGTASKSLVPALRLGWLLVPHTLQPVLERLRSRRDLGSDCLTQLTFAELLRSGSFDRHLRRLRAHYATRHKTLADAVRQCLPQAWIGGAAAGLHAYVQLPRHTDEAALVAGALRRSVLVRGGREFSTRPGGSGPALVVGYTGTPRSGLVEAVRAVRAAHAELPGSRRFAGRVRAARTA